MRKLLLTAVAAILFAVTASATDIKDILVKVSLRQDGSALIHETWDIDADEGTEWYLIRDGLDGSVISGFHVWEDGRMFTDEGEWNVDRSRREKAWRSGIVHKSNGVELCWGIGEYDHHVYEAEYLLSDAVRAIDDADYFHWQLVNPGLSARPEHVKVVIESEGMQLDTTFARAWGFGYVGTVTFSDGRVEFESTETFKRKSSVIALLRFDKGVFSPSMTESGSFDSRYQKAMKGASFEDDEDDDSDALAGFFTFLFMVLMALPLIKGFLKSMKMSGTLLTRRDKKKLLGVYPNEVQWNREPPFGGDLLQTNYGMMRLGEINSENTIPSAMILRMIYNGQLIVGKDADGKIEISFGDGSKLKDLDAPARELYDMMKEASGSDTILQDKEFSKWSRKYANQKRVSKWVDSCESAAKDRLWKAGYTTRHIGYIDFTPNGQARLREALGLKKFLQDFTLVKEKASVEVHMWQEYLVFASLFGIADKVAKELKDIDTRIYDQATMYDSVTTYELLRMTNLMSRAITNARAYYSASTYSSSSGSRGGYGGHSSFGGGGGFHGGGFGGGAR